mmetsp:Transcript_25481/g.52119  ORF Transcript_25481/g.52119 Transcript_25481/m.52119 type:complete len:269 (-) Transcript_25481:115-921(-)|eukprot:CAMPEP_0183315524 /NCGR_PEP_ID=MMETSP0160_2-20130417/52072_1 /TAXON_ID=2839 ORGANISM="Odontella Sinensis, Strain Grunow 1884" /NCGR_SAMPLE_ID=MMETSP0160_2 /ASSEMBLY_ACC=CAM_ASM_000250 /LENGTH=268 /DNA_ID=CAMNT_0025481099 /DNA_START=68 /DNA_END=874 /DNA_ORIENTATION=+
MTTRRSFLHLIVRAELVAVAAILLSSCSLPAAVLASDDEECLLECGEHGECRKSVNEPADNWGAIIPEDFFDDFCSCEDGWDGHDCSIPHEICPDGLRKCQNGGTCKKREGISSASPLGQGESAWECHCPNEFEGLDCEYVKGTASPEVSKEENNDKFGKKTSNAGEADVISVADGAEGGIGKALTAFIVISSLLIVFGIGSFVQIVVRDKKETHNMIRDRVRGELFENSQVGVTESAENKTPQEQVKAGEGVFADEGAEPPSEIEII